jgi:Domain of unknown function (DUF4253)
VVEAFVDAQTLRERLAELGCEVPEPQLSFTTDRVPVYGLEVAPDRHRDLWSRLRAVHHETGLWPFTSHEKPTNWADESRASGVELVDRLVGLRLDPQDVVDELVRANWDRAVDYAGGDPDRLESALIARDPARIADELEPAPSQPGPGESRIERTRAYPPRWIHLVPAAHGYEIPALLDGPVTVNWVGSPGHPDLTAADHCAVLRSWQERYGAELYYFSDTAIELTVTAPPLEAVEAAGVAVEQYAYCPDLDGWLGDPVDVVRRQVWTRRWYFWWD